MVKAPVISVVMAVYNGEPFLVNAIESILNQTFTDFEFLIVDDGSTDNTGNILEEFAASDSRVIIIHQENIGLTESLNRLCKIAKGEFIARMDADDISLPERIEKQAKKLQETPDYLAVGCWFQTIAESGMPNVEILFPDDPEILKDCLHKGINCYGHGSVMMKKKVFKTNGLSYRFKYGQDFDLWLRLSEQGSLGMVEEVLYQRRDHGHTLSKALIPQRAALMNCMLSLMRERKTHGREISKWKEEEGKILNGVPQWTEKEITAHNMFLEARRLLCSGENSRARQILSLIKRDLKHFDNVDVAYYISFLPGFLTAPLLRFRDKINNKRHFVKVRDL